MTSPQGGGSGLTDSLQNKIGPLKTWQWAAIITVVGLGWIAWQRHTGQSKPASNASSTTNSTTADYAGEQQIPQFVIQNQMPTSEPSTSSSSTSTTTSSSPAPNVANGFYRNVSQQGYGNIYEVSGGKRYSVSPASWARIDKGKSAPKVQQIDNSWVGFQLPKQSTVI